MLVIRNLFLSENWIGVKKLQIVTVQLSVVKFLILLMGLTFQLIIKTLSFLYLDKVSVGQMLLLRFIRYTRFFMDKIIRGDTIWVDGVRKILILMQFIPEFIRQVAPILLIIGHLMIIMYLMRIISVLKQ